MKNEKKEEKARKRRSTGGEQAIALGPRGVSAEDSPTINAVKEKSAKRT